MRVDRRPPPRVPVAVLVVLLALLGLAIAALLAIGGYLVAHNLVILPREYDRLAASGVPVTGRVVAFDRGKSGRICELAYTYSGTSRRFLYTQDTGQFGAVGDSVNLLVDPTAPATVFTVHDVQARYQDPFELPLGLGTLLITVAGVSAGAVGFRRGAFKLRR